MITANEARNMTDSNANIEGQLREAFSRIENAAKDGKGNVEIHRSNPFNKSVRKLKQTLTDLGYDVHIDPVNIYIRW